MSKQIILLPGWGLGIEPLQLLAQELRAALPDFNVQIQPLPNMQGQDAAQVLQQLDQQLPSDCWLVGWSLGGMLASALAAQRPRSGSRRRCLASIPPPCSRIGAGRLRKWPHSKRSR